MGFDKHGAHDECNCDACEEKRSHPVNEVDHPAHYNQGDIGMNSGLTQIRREETILVR